MKNKELVKIPHERVANLIYLIRGHKVMLDSDLAELYSVETGALNRAVKRNQKRFPKEFMFQLTTEEADALRCQTGISSLRSQTGISNKRGGRRYQPYVFSEHGVAMLSSVLRSDRAIEINILIIKAFVHMRELLETSEILRAKLNAMEAQLGDHSKAIQKIYQLLMHHLDEPVKPKNPMGFQPPKKRK